MDRKRSKSREGRGAREGGETSCEWRRKGSADDETGTCGSACALHVFIIDTTCACTRWGGEGAGGGGGGTRCTSPEEESHSKHSQMIKGFWDNLQHPTFRFMEKMNRLSFHFRAAAASSSITDIFFLFLTYMSFKTKCQEAREANIFTQ